MFNDLEGGEFARVPHQRGLRQPCLDVTGGNSGVPLGRVHAEPRLRSGMTRTRCRGRPGGLGLGTSFSYQTRERYVKYNADRIYGHRL